MDRVKLESNIESQAERVKQRIIEKAISLSKSGGIDLESYSCEEAVSKVLVLAAIESELPSILGFISQQAIKDIKNLQHF